MSRFLLRVGGFCALQLLIALVVIWFGAEEAKQAVNTDSYFLAMKDKMELLRGEGHSRIVFVGGSNVAFGIQSELLADALQRQPVNMGLHGALGLSFPLRCAQDGIRDGDLVVVMPEYHVLTGRLHANLEHATEMISLWPEAKRYLDTTDERIVKMDVKLFLDREGLYLIHERVHRTRLKLWHLSQQTNGSAVAARRPQPDRRKSLPDRRNPTPQPRKTVYRRSGFNQYGDMVAHHGLIGKPMDCSACVTPLSHQNRKCLDAAIQMLNDFNSVCHTKGAKVYFSYPPIPDTMFNRSQDGIREIHERLGDSLQIPIVTCPEQTRFAAELFFDTVNHLTQEGAKLRSEVDVQAISPYIQSIEGGSFASRRVDTAHR